MDILNELILTNIEEIITIPSFKGRYEEINDRPFYGLSFCVNGKITYTHNGKDYVSDSNHAIFLPEGQSYTLYGDEKGIFPVINFKCLNFLCDTFAVLPIKNVGAYIKDYEHMKSLYLFEGNRAKIMSIFYNIIHRLASEAESQNNILKPAVKYLEENYSDPKLTNSMLAQECNISDIYFRKLFTEQYGVSPKQFIIDIRINRAKQLLTDGTLKITAIAEKCGFSNPYHFCRVFKQKAGVTPTEYMKQNRIYKI